MRAYVRCVRMGRGNYTNRDSFVLTVRWVQADDTPDKAKPTVDTDDEGSGGTKRTRRETLEAEQFSPEIIKSFRLKIPATPLERKKLTFST